MEELYTRDAFGNQLNIGDIVIAATQIIQSPSIKMGKIIGMSKGKPYEAYNFNNGANEKYKVAKWRIEWIKYPMWTSDRLKIKESTIHGLNLYKI